MSPLRLLAAVLLLSSLAAAAPACPQLPQAPKQLKRFHLSAAKLRGSKTQTLAYNGSVVGPIIRARVGDNVQVDVTNKDIPEGTSVHWHGQDLPGAAWADGVAGVSQAPIPVGATFSYRFKAEPAGTYWYHSHTGEQFGDGLRGPLIIEDPEDPLRKYYDLDLDQHVLMLADVFLESQALILQGLETGGMSMGGGAAAATPGGGNSMGGAAAAAPAPGGHGAAAAAPKAAAGGDAMNSMATEAPAAAMGAPASAGAMGGMGGMAAAGPAPAPAMAMAMGGRRRLAQAAMAMPGPAPVHGAAAAAPTPPPAPAHGAAAPARAAGPAGAAAPCTPEEIGRDVSDAPWNGAQVNGAGFGTKAPHVMTVTPGKRHRVRVIGGMSSWAFEMVPGGGHQIQIIALDGRPVTPTKARSVTLNSGERADFVLAADRPVGNYWVSLFNLLGNNSPFILHYQGAPDPLTDKAFLAKRPGDRGCASAKAALLVTPNAGAYTALAGTAPPPPQAASKVFPIFLADAATTAPPPALARALRSAPPAAAAARGFAPAPPVAGKPECPAGAAGFRSKYCWSMNWNVYEPAPAPLNFPGAKFAARTYDLAVNEGDVVDLVFVNPSRMAHPMHIHGTGLRVIAEGRGRPLADRPAGGNGAWALRPGLALNLRDPPVRDTLTVPPAAPPAGAAAEEGYTYIIARVKVTNPGTWALHCHIDLHAASGMFMTLTVKPRAAGLFVPKGASCGAAP